MSTKQNLSKGDELTETQIETLRGIFSADEFNYIVVALREKASVARNAAAMGIEGTGKDIPGIRDLAAALNEQADHRERLANAIEACQ